MSHFATLVTRAGTAWRGAEVDLSEAEDVEDVADLMRDAADDAECAILFVEEDDEWFAAVRVDRAGEPRVFLSDVRMVVTSELAALLFADMVAVDAAGGSAAISDDEDDDGADEDDEIERPTVRSVAEPGGATEIFADLGVSADDLLGLCAEEGQLPADVLSAICERLGCVDEIEVYR